MRLATTSAAKGRVTKNRKVSLPSASRAIEVDQATNRLAYDVIGAAIEVQTELGGPGLLEEIHEEALCIELGLRGIPFERQRRLPVYYKGRETRKYYVLDLLVGGVLLVELKATAEDHQVYQAQCRTQLVLTNLHLGLVINFGQRSIKQGVHRVFNEKFRGPVERRPAEN